MDNNRQKDKKTKTGKKAKNGPKGPHSSKSIIEPSLNEAVESFETLEVVEDSKVEQRKVHSHCDTCPGDNVSTPYMSNVSPQKLQECDLCSLYARTKLSVS